VRKMPVVARILMVAGGRRGRRLASAMIANGHAVRITTRTEAERSAIEETGAECWIGTPDRLATLRGALENVTIVCWLLGSAKGSRQAVRVLHGSRLELFLTQAIDTTVRGFVYESRGTTTPAEDLLDGERIVRAAGERNAIPVAFLRADPNDRESWLKAAADAVEGLLARA
jgi:NAD(P)H-binding